MGRQPWPTRVAEVELQSAPIEALVIHVDLVPQRHFLWEKRFAASLYTLWSSGGYTSYNVLVAAAKQTEMQTKPGALYKARGWSEECDEDEDVPTGSAKVTLEYHFGDLKMPSISIADLLAYNLG